MLGSDRPLWTRHDRAGRPGAPLSSRSFAENLKLYTREAGIEKIHVHQTRHTYARIVAEETGSFSDTQEALDHQNAATTRVYVPRITVKADKHSSKVARRMRRTSSLHSEKLDANSQRVALRCGTGCLMAAAQQPDRTSIAHIALGAGTTVREPRGKSCGHLIVLSWQGPLVLGHPQENQNTNLRAN